MINTIYKIGYNDTIVSLMCILLVYYVMFPLVKKLIFLYREEKEEGENINV